MFPRDLAGFLRVDKAFQDMAGFFAPSFHPLVTRILSLCFVAFLSIRFRLIPLCSIIPNSAETTLGVRFFQGPSILSFCIRMRSFLPPFYVHLGYSSLDSLWMIRVWKRWNCL